MPEESEVMLRVPLESAFGQIVFFYLHACFADIADVVLNAPLILL